MDGYRIYTLLHHGGNRYLQVEKGDRTDNNAHVDVNTTTNNTNQPHLLSNQRDSLPQEYRVLITCCGICIILFTTMGNLATVLAVKMNKKLRSISNLYLASLASADLLVGGFVMALMLLYTVTFNGIWLFGQAFCDVWNFVDYVACSASLTNVCAIAVDRFQTVSQPMRAIHRRTKRRAYRFILTAWIIPILGWFIVIVIMRYENGRPPDGQCFLAWDPPYSVLLVAAIFVYTPLLLTILLFLTIMYLLKRHMSGMHDRLSGGSSRRHHQSFDSCGDTTSEKSGGVSFNAKFFVDTVEASLPPDGADKGIAMVEFSGQRSCSDVNTIGVQQFVSESVQTVSGCHDLDLEYFKGGKHFRSIGTSTSPERYGLVRSIATNTSPSLSHSMRNLPDVAEDAHLQSSLSTLHTVGGDLHSDSDTIHTFNSSESPSRGCTSDSDTFSGSGSPRWRRRYASLLRCRRESSLERSRLKQQMKAAKTLGIIMTFLLLSWLPFAIMWPVKTYCPSCISQRTYDISIWVNYLNSSINPIIYCLCNPNFRKTFKRLFTRQLCRFTCKT